MAKPVICDRCGKIKPEKEFSKVYYFWTEDPKLYVEMKFYSGPVAKVECDICRDCANEIIKEVGKVIDEGKILVDKV